MAGKNPQQVEEIFHVALDLPPEKRTAYLAEACSGDKTLYVEVESLISALENSGGFLDESTLRLGMEVLSNTLNDSMEGKSLGPYKVETLLGKGGMGEVYLAEDTRLGRKVALKFLSRELTGDNWGKRQLVREAQAVAMLDHANICTVYGIEEASEHSFIVMQYVEGETLADLIRTQALAPAEALRLAQQMVSALAEAHAHGIIHRDIKPRNIMVTKSGQVKVLDFGLAKTIQQKQSLASAADSTSHLSPTGLLAGTVAYMSPEQLRGEKLDYRSDLFSMGTVLYEIVTGKNPYAKESTAETISAILTAQPPRLGDSVPEGSRELDQIITKCLQKDLDQRYQAASALLYDLNNLPTEGKAVARWRSYVYSHSIALFALLLLLMTIAAFIYSRMTRVYSLAVLPIVNETGPANDYLSHGLTDALTQNLSGLSQLRVKPLTTVSGYRANEVNLQSVGANLGVDALLIGKIVEEEGSLILETTLVDVVSGSRRRLGRNKLTLAEAFTLPETVSSELTSNLDLWLGKTDRKRQAARGTENAEAFRLYMLGRYYWKNRNKENIEKAIGYFNEAIRVDPVYAQAYAGLADCYVLRTTVAFGDMTTEDAMARANAAAKEALRIDEELPEAHTALSLIHLKHDWNWPDAEREIKRALELNQDYAPAHYAYSTLLTILGRQNEALIQSKVARDLDPFSLSAKMNFCRSFYYARDFEKSVSCFQEILKEDPDNSLAWYVFGFVALQQGRPDEAIRIFEKLYGRDKSFGTAALGYAYGKAGRKEDAMRMLAAAKQLREQNKQFPSQEIAIIYLGLGDKNNALVWLEKAYEERFAALIYLTSEPIFGELHSEARFVALARHLNLNPPQ